MDFGKITANKYLGFAVAVVGVVIVTLALKLVHGQLNSTTVALALLLVVLFVATFFGRNPALLASFAAMLSFNYFFLPPIHTWTISETENLVAWAAFTVTALIAGELSSYARRRAREAEKYFAEMQLAFETASKAEAFKRGEKLKSALLDAVTHDLRTPLTSIKASVTMLLEENSDEAIHITMDNAGRSELLAVINEETDRLNNFVESMVDVAKLEAGEFDLRKERISVVDLLERTLNRAERITSNHVIELNADADSGEISADSRALTEAVYNLIDNAVKFSPKGSKISVSAKSNQNSTEISVEDEGSGISEADREKVFEKFFRSGNREKGFGMGLAIVKGIAEAHGGKVWVESGKRGARFVLSLPKNGND